MSGGRRAALFSILAAAVLAALLVLTNTDAPDALDPSLSTDLAVYPQERRDPALDAIETWLCPVHLEQQAHGPGACPVCGRDLVRRFVVGSYSCPMHSHIDEDEPGSCPLCHMKLVVMNREVEWYCPDNPRESSTTPATCSSTGEPMVARTIPISHGDHNPRHGGQLFMAPAETLDHHRFHHIEGALTPEGEFRLYLYDDFTNPLPATGFPYTARIGDEVLQPGPGRQYLATWLVSPGPESYPVDVRLHVDFPRDDERETYFDFRFAEEMGVDLSELRVFEIPEESDAIFREILRRDEYLTDFMSKGAWPELHVPALQAKDLALALIEREDERFALPGKRLVQAAWLLDIFGDEGNRDEVERAYGLFEAALGEIEAALGEAGAEPEPDEPADSAAGAPGDSEEGAGIEADHAP